MTVSAEQWKVQNDLEVTELANNKCFRDAASRSKSEFIQFGSDNLPKARVEFVVDRTLKLYTQAFDAYSDRYPNIATAIAIDAANFALHFGRKKEAREFLAAEARVHLSSVLRNIPELNQ